MFNIDPYSHWNTISVASVKEFVNNKTKLAIMSINVNLQAKMLIGIIYDTHGNYLSCEQNEMKS